MKDTWSCNSFLKFSSESEYWLFIMSVSYFTGHCYYCIIPDPIPRRKQIRRRKKGVEKGFFYLRIVSLCSNTISVYPYRSPVIIIANYQIYKNYGYGQNIAFVWFASNQDSRCSPEIVCFSENYYRLVIIKIYINIKKSSAKIDKVNDLAQISDLLIRGSKKTAVTERLFLLLLSSWSD